MEAMFEQVIYGDLDSWSLFFWGVVSIEVVFFEVNTLVGFYWTVLLGVGFWEGFRYKVWKNVFDKV